MARLTAPDAVAGRAYRAAVIRWLRVSMRGPDGRDKMTRTELIKRSKVGRTSLYRLLKGEADAEPETLARLATALKVPVPLVVRTLVVAPAAAAAPVTPVATLREAAALIEDTLAALDAHRNGTTPARPGRTSRMS